MKDYKNTNRMITRVFCAIMALVFWITAIAFLTADTMDKTPGYVFVVLGVICFLPVLLLRKKKDNRQNQKTVHPSPIKQPLAKNQPVHDINKPSDIPTDSKRLQNDLAELTRQAMEQSELFAQKLRAEIDRIQWDIIQNIVPGEPEPLSEVEILFLHYCDGHSIKPFQIAGYWVHDYELDLNQVLQKLFRSGYLAFSDIPFALSKTVVPELKSILSSHNLKVSGKKSELVARILDSVPVQDLWSYNNTHLQLTEEGQRLVQENAYLFFFCKAPVKYSIPIEEAAFEHSLYPDLPAPALARQILTRQLKERQDHKDWGLYRNALSEIAFTYQKEQNDQQAFPLLLQVYLLDALGFENGGLRMPKLGFTSESGVMDIADYLDTHPKTNLKASLQKAAGDLPVTLTPQDLQLAYSHLRRDINETKKQA